MLSQAPEPASKTLQRTILIFLYFQATGRGTTSSPAAPQESALGEGDRAKTAEHPVPPPSSCKRSPPQEMCKELRREDVPLCARGWKMPRMGCAELWLLSEGCWVAWGQRWWLRAGSAELWLSVPERRACAEPPRAPAAAAHLTAMLYK